MGLFSYVAMGEEGEERRGDMSASDARSAAVMLRRQGLYVVALNEIEVKENDADLETSYEIKNVSDIFYQIGQMLGSLKPIRNRDRVLFLQQTALMLRSGLTLVQCVEEARHTTSKPRFSAALGRISRALRSGKCFSHAINQEGTLFPAIVIKLIESAEVSGEMDTIMDKIVTHLDQREQMKMNLLTSLIYPIVVVLVMIAVFIFLIMKVVPKFATFFLSRNVRLPWSTQVLIDLSTLAQSYGLFLLGGLAIAVAFFMTCYASQRGRRIIDKGILMVPVVGTLLTTGAMAHISQTLSILLQSGVTLIESLQVVKGLSGNREIAFCLEQASEQILAGKSLASGLQHTAIPRLVSQVVAVGERTGALVDVLRELGEFYDQQVQIITKRMSILIEPVLILIIGGMVGFVYFAFFQAIFQVATAGR